MNRVQAVFDVTIKMNETMNQDISSHNRDVVMEQIDLLLKKREGLLLGLKEPFTDEEKQLGMQLVQLNEDVKKRMNAEFSILKKEMKQIKKQKATNQNYANPYRNVAVMDGMYMDKKK